MERALQLGGGRVFFCNSGTEAIEAALNPDDTNFLYFVADGSGGHAFAETLEEHNANVARWRELERQQQQQNSP